jgi:putative ABC transport system permease protein
MIRNFFRIALRNLFRQRAYSLFNLIGLALGIACGLLLTLHIKEELGYEKSFSKHNRIYRMVSTEWSKSSPPMAAEMMKYFPEIKSIARFSSRGKTVVNTRFNTQAEANGFFADSTAIDMFDMHALAGKPAQALQEPFAVVITSRLAKQLFGNRDPIGQKLVFGDHEEMWVRAVIRDFPANSHLKFDYLTSMSTLYKYLPAQWANNRHWMFGWTYVELNRNEDIVQARKKLRGFYAKYFEGIESKEDALSEGTEARFQPLTDIHLKSDLIQEMGANSSITYIYILIAVEVLILLIACVNFINLFTTQALKRLREIGMRKLLGASKGQVIAQFMGEAFILTFMAGLLAIVLYQSSLPFYNSLTGRQIRIWEIFKAENLLIIISLILSVGCISGIFPALFVSRFKPIQSLKAIKTPGSSATYVRKGLVIFQFVVSGLLIICTILIFQQMQLFRNKKMGFNKDQVLVASLYGKLKDQLIGHPEVIQNEFLKDPDIIAIGKSSNIIGDDLSVESVTPPNPPAGKEYPSVRAMRVDENYIPVMSIELKEGRNFSTRFNDSTSFIINEKAAQVLGLKNPLNSELVDPSVDVQGKVVGIIKDFHFASLHHPVEPLVLMYKPQWTGNLLIKIRAGKTAEAIDFLKSKIASISPGTLFSYQFLDEHISELYKKEDNISAILKVFAGLAIVISCLGLFGLVAHASEIRTKEIGIRKVIGAGVGNLVGLMSKDLMLLVLIGNLLAWPLSWWLMHKWLEQFTDRIQIGWTVFISSLMITLLIAILTIAYHCIKTANANPVKSLRTE